MNSINKNLNYHKWSFEEINDFAFRNPEYFVNDVEISFKKVLNDTVDKIIGLKDCKIVLVSGPSSSGKTTFSNMICEELVKRGIWSGRVSLDNFYKGIKGVPVLDDGSLDFESIEGLDIKKIQQCLNEIIKSGSSIIPTYDFSKRAPAVETEKIEVPSGGILLVEGLHAISPKITDKLNQESIIKIYINIISGVRKSDEVFFSPKNIRLIRRIQRDYRYRYTHPKETLHMWNNIVRGEKLYIRPLRNFADIKVDTFHAYEPCVMGKGIINFLEEISDDNMKDLINRLSQFNSIDEKLVPQDSLMREFI